MYLESSNLLASFDRLLRHCGCVYKQAHCWEKKTAKTVKISFSKLFAVQARYSPCLCGVSFCPHACKCFCDTMESSAELYIIMCQLCLQPTQGHFKEVWQEWLFSHGVFSCTCPQQSTFIGVIMHFFITTCQSDAYQCKTNAYKNTRLLSPTYRHLHLNWTEPQT